MATVVQKIPEQPGLLTWLGEFFQEELTPYPGRVFLVVRMVIASTVVMIVTMTFKIPFGAYGAIYAFTISRESTEATLTSAKTAIVTFALSGLYIIIGAITFAGDPFLRILWIIGTLFLLFYALSATTNYFAANRFGYLVAITIALWDRHVPARIQVEDTLWAIFSVMSASLITVAFELIFEQLKPWDDLVQSIADRLSGVEKLLDGYNSDRPVDEMVKKEVTRQSMRGTSRLRRILKRSSYSPQYADRMSAIVALTGRLVDLAANLAHLDAHLSSDEDRKRTRALANAISSIRTDLLDGRPPSSITFDTEADTIGSVPLFREMQTTVLLISEVFAHSPSMSRYAPARISTDTRWTLFTADAFSNPEHIKFGLRGCFAASLCYITYNAVDWPGISTSVTTCLLTALSTIGSSRQKQVLRFAGAILGGFVFGMGAQIFILPNLDSIWGFTALYVSVIAVAAWIATASPRLSYGGAQTAVAFCLLNLQEFKIQTSLAVARDRVVGILFGLTVMWIVFDQIGGAPAAIEMKRAFISSVRRLAEFVRQPGSSDAGGALERASSMREAINKSIDEVRSLGDAVLLEFGSSREQDLALRNQIKQWVPQLRMIFVTRIALLKYQLDLPGFELPKEVHAAQQDFDEQLGQLLDGMADRLEGKPRREETKIDASLEQLEKTTRLYLSQETGKAFLTQLQTFIPLSRRIEELTASLDREI